MTNWMEKNHMGRNRN